MGSVSSLIPEKAWAKCLDNEAGSSASEIRNVVTGAQPSTGISDKLGQRLQAEIFAVEEEPELEQCYRDAVQVLVIPGKKNLKGLSMEVKSA